MRSGFADRVNKLGAPRHGTGNEVHFSPGPSPHGEKGGQTARTVLLPEL